ncbi:hypothetical protein EDB19DRAFT_1706298, partial [Suillus lakei]
VIPGSTGTTLIEQCGAGAHIDEDMAALAESLRILRSDNEPLISCLPPEILTNIFAYTGGEPYEIHTGTQRRHFGAMITTHVCRRWRQVAIECPTLWTSIDDVPPRWLAILLERSKEAALIVRYILPSSLKPCAEQILPQLPRIKVLDLCSPSFDADRILDYLSSQPAPLLQMFRLGVLGSFHPRITDTIFQGRAPQLRSVKLTRCTFNWSLFIFSGLRTLDVRRIGRASCPTLSHLLSVLKRMPDLEQLMLELSSEDEDTDEIEDTENTELFDEVSLTRLKNIALDGFPIHTTISLFSHLLLPVDVKIALNLARTESPGSFPELFSAMYKDPDESFPVIQAIRADFRYGLFDVQFCTSTVFKSEYFWDPRHGDIPLSIRLQCDLEPTMIFYVCQMAPHCKIQHLFVSSSHDPLEHFWRTGSIVLPELESMHLSVSTPIGGLIAALQIGDEQKLRHSLDYIPFGCNEPGYLQDVLKMRAERGVGINKLQLEKCRNLTGDKVQLLRDVVTEFDWDGHEEELFRGGGGCPCANCTVATMGYEIPVDSTNI